MAFLQNQEANRVNLSRGILLLTNEQTHQHRGLSLKINKGKFLERDNDDPGYTGFSLMNALG